MSPPDRIPSVDGYKFPLLFPGDTSFSFFLFYSSSVFPPCLRSKYQGFPCPVPSHTKVFYIYSLSGKHRLLCSSLGHRRLCFLLPVIVLLQPRYHNGHSASVLPARGGSHEHPLQGTGPRQPLPCLQSVWIAAGSFRFQHDRRQSHVWLDLQLQKHQRRL